MSLLPPLPLCLRLEAAGRVTGFILAGLLALQESWGDVETC